MMHWHYLILRFNYTGFSWSYFCLCLLAVLFGEFFRALPGIHGRKSGNSGKSLLHCPSGPGCCLVVSLFPPQFFFLYFCVVARTFKHKGKLFIFIAEQCYHICYLVTIWTSKGSWSFRSLARWQICSGCRRGELVNCRCNVHEVTAGHTEGVTIHICTANGAPYAVHGTCTGEEG